MNVQQLIDKLLKVNDKTKTVIMGSDDHDFDLNEVIEGSRQVRLVGEEIIDE